VTAPLLAPGSMLASRWIVGGLLGQNDLAEVYEAEEASQRRFAAIKLLRADFAAEPGWGEHVALTRALSELPGEGIARAYDIGVEPALGRPYVASERITFPTLARYVGERGPMPLRALAQALMTLGPALDAAHAAGIVHGGLKPQNVFVSFDNPRWARITDFAFGRLRSAGGRGPAALLGWSAPEAAAGFSTPAGDRYSLALVCFFAASGVPWYNALRALDAPPSDRRTRVASERAKSQGGEIEPLFDPWFAKALAADPEARFGTAAEMAAAFIDVFTGAPTTELAARSSMPGMSATQPISPSQVPAPPGGQSAALAETLPIKSAQAQAQVGLRPGTEPPRASAPPTHESVPPTLPLASAPRWFWLGLLGIALFALLSIWWLGSR